MCFANAMCSDDFFFFHVIKFIGVTLIVLVISKLAQIGARRARISYVREQQDDGALIHLSLQGL